MVASTKRGVRKSQRSPTGSSPRIARPSLAAYNAKRDFAKTTEPKGVVSRAGSGNSFVVQQHDAGRMHFDFRLELGGVLLSWAVPKGPSLDPKVRRLAVRTEDHPIAYRTFEGAIPAGEYGGGQIIVWDRGSWTPAFDPHLGLRKGHLRFNLEGEKLHGEYSLVRTKGAGAGSGNTWLLLKHDDAHARNGRDAEIAERMPQSVISDRTVKQAAAGRTSHPKPAQARKSRVKPPVVRKRSRTGSAPPALSTVELQLATLGDGPPANAHSWAHEIKFDGYRMAARLQNGRVELRSRNGLDWTQTFPAITAALKNIGARSAILDGEVCHVDEEGRTSFQRLQNALPRGGTGQTPRDQSRIVYYLFDILFDDGVDVRGEGLLERKSRLKERLGKSPPKPLVYSEHLQGNGSEALTQACAAGLEGLIAKRIDAPYRAGRGKDWIKLKCQRRQEFIIVGWTKPTGARSGFGSLLLAVRENDELRYRGKVGTGFTEKSLADLSRQLARRKVEKSPLAEPPRLRDVTWVRPDLVCEVEFTEQTRDGSLRHPSFQGLRADKPAREVVQERAVAITKSSSKQRKSSASLPDHDAEVAGVHISHPERIIESVSGLTKLQLAEYHEAMTQWMLPYTRGRPISIVRCPQGDAQACFFQKQKMPGLSAAVRKKTIAGHETIHVDDLAGVIELVQFNTIEFHGWGATAKDPRHPDWIVMDLDPDPSVTFAAVAEAALEMRDALAELGLRSFVKTTGGKGLHVVAPLTPRSDWDAVKSFTHGLATLFAQRWPDRYVDTSSKAKRKAKVFIDYLRNGQGATAVLPYSPRARPRATVAMPIEWRDVRKVDPSEFTVQSALRWVNKRKKDPWAGFFEIKQRLPDVTP